MKKIFSLFLTVALIFEALCVFPLAAPTESKTEGMDLNLDYIFVIDGSGSMCTSDPKSLAREACKLFTNMCDYGSSRAGYIVFSGEIRDSYPLATLSDEISREKFLKSLSSITYPSYASTDISLGLTAAKNVLINNNSMDGSRSPMIILLSDGRTEDLSTQRKEVYESEFSDTLAFLKENKVPVYTIALNSSGKADEETLGKIANETDALTFTTKTADDLPAILSKILAHRLQSNMENIAEFDGDGQAHTININIPNDGIYQANIIILSGKGAENIHLLEPSGNEVVIPSNNVSYSKSNSYQLIKISKPTKGDWKLSLTGVDKDHVTVNLINNYDIMMQLKANKSSVKNGDSATFALYCSNVADTADMFSGAEAVLTVYNEDTGEEKQYDMSRSGNEMTASVEFDKAGNYKVSAVFVAKDGDYERSTNTISYTVTPAELLLLDGESGEKRVTLFTKFLFFKIANKKEFSLSGILTQDASAEVKASFVPGGWEDVCEASFDENNNAIVIRGVKKGTGTLNVSINDNFGQTLPITISVKVIPGIVLFAIILAGLAVLAALFLLIRHKRMPMIKGTVILSVALPDTMSDKTPPESEYNLATLSKKGKVSLSEVIGSNLTTNGQYMNALGGIMGFVNNVKFEAADSECSNLWIYLPGTDKAGQVSFNNLPVEKACKQTLSLNYPTHFSYSGFDGTYRFTVTYKNGGFGGVGFTYEANSFGGGSDSGGFGGFGGFGGNDTAGNGPNDTGSFGSFGSFGGGNDQGFGNSGSGEFGSFDSSSNSGFGNF